MLCLSGSGILARRCGGACCCSARGLHALLADGLSFVMLCASCTRVTTSQFATEAAITILRIDDLITLEAQQEGGDE